MADRSAFDTAINNYFVVIVLDDHSGLDPNARIYVSLRRQGGSGAVTTLLAQEPQASLALQIDGGQDDGAGDYYTYEAYAQDLAGNRTGTITRTVAIDSESPNVFAVAPQGLWVGNGTAIIQSSAMDNLDLIRGTAAIYYPSLNVFLRFTGSDFDIHSAFSGTPVRERDAISISIPNLVRNVQLVDAGGAPPENLTASKPSQATVGICDPFTFGQTAGGIPDVQVQEGVPFTAAQVGAWRIDSVDAPAVQLGGAPVTIVTRATAPSGSPIPFSRVAFLALNSAEFANVLMEIGTAPMVTEADDGVTRTFVASIAWSPNAEHFDPGEAWLLAVGVGAAGDGLATRIEESLLTIVP